MNDERAELAMARLKDYLSVTRERADPTYTRGAVAVKLILLSRIYHGPSSVVEWHDTTAEAEAMRRG